MTEQFKLKKYLYFLVVLLKDNDNRIKRNSISSIQVELFETIEANESKAELINRLKHLIKEIIQSNMTFKELNFLAEDIQTNLPETTRKNKFEFIINSNELTFEYKDNFIKELQLVDLN